MGTTLSIKQIFQNHWQQYDKSHLPDYAISQIEKMLNCRNPNKLGFHKYACEDHPDQFVVVPHSCKCSFCNTCGKIRTDKLVAKVEAIFPTSSFHHVYFTIPDSLWELLSKHHFLLDCLFIASAKTILNWAKRERHFLPAIVAALHTFGKNQKKFNPHTHMLVSSGGFSLKPGKLNQWKNCPTLPWKVLTTRFPHILIKELKKAIRKHLDSNEEPGDLAVFSYPGVLDNFFDPLLEKDWYVHDSEDIPYKRFTVSYITRYANRPPIAQSRITDYGQLFKDQSDTCVSFYFKDITNGSTIHLTTTVDDFISSLAQHILPPQFRKVRYYGAIANRNRPRYLKLIAKHSRKDKHARLILSWRQRIKRFTGKDPLICPICQKEMILVEMAFFSKTQNCLVSRAPP